MPDDVFTLLANVNYLQNNWLPYVYSRKAVLNPIYASGLLNQDASLAEYAKAKGRTFTVPYFNVLGGNDQLFTSNSRVSVDNIDTSTMTGTRNIRWTAWGYEDLAAAITGADPAKAIGDQAALWEVNQDMAAIGAVLTGLFTAGGALNTPQHYRKFASETAAGMTINGNPNATKFNGANLQSALVGALGQYANKFAVLVVNSGVYLQMQLSNLVQNVTIQLPSQVSVDIPTFLGKYGIVVDDTAAPVRNGTENNNTGPLIYRSYAFAPGSIGYGTGLPPELLAFESRRIVEEKKTVSVYMRGFVIHPYGLTYTGAACAKEWPTNDEYATPANWQIAEGYLPKDIPFMAIDTN